MNTKKPTTRKKKKKEPPLSPSKGYLVFDPGLCTGCHTCEAICSFVKEGLIRPALARIQVHTDPFKGTVENFMPRPCLQCETPQCMLACPVEGAMYIHELTGARVINEDTCIGCKQCITACGAFFEPARIIFHPEKKISLKCDLCSGNPACVTWCPNGALKYINRSEFVEKGSCYRLSFTEAFDKDFGPTCEPFEGPMWRYQGPWLTEE